MRFLTAAPFFLIAAAARGDEKTDFFEKQIRPLLAERCYECHGIAKPKGGLRLTSRAELLKGGDSGAVVVPGKPDESLLLKAVRYQDDQLKMPPKGRFSDSDIKALTRWVALGLAWADDKPAGGNAQSQFQITEEQRRFWSFQPVRRPAGSAVRNTA